MSCLSLKPRLLLPYVLVTSWIFFRGVNSTGDVAQGFIHAGQALLLRALEILFEYGMLALINWNGLMLSYTAFPSIFNLTLFSLMHDELEHVIGVS